VTLREPVLDERKFQDLVDEAKVRISRTCKEWTDHNVSDPGVTLIETFAWMTEILIHRLNHLPRRLHEEFLELLGIERAPPTAARTELRFMLAAPAEQRVKIAADETEVTSIVGEDPVVFRVPEDFLIRPVRPAAFVIERRRGIEPYRTDEGTASPGQLAYSDPPLVDEAIYLGFDEPIARLVLRVQVTGQRAHGRGIDPDTPPLAWEVSAEGGFARVEKLEDTTGGFNADDGHIVLQMPAETSRVMLAGRRLHWLRCRIDQHADHEQTAPRYEHPPRIDTITARAVGALLPAGHFEVVKDEELGISDGTPGQVFKLRHTPALDLARGETLMVRPPGDRNARPWTLRRSFEGSDADDRHFRFDPTVGEVVLGPAIRRKDGSWRQHGAIPPPGSRLSMSRYRYGSAERGNTPKDTLQRMRKPIPGVARVTNPVAAQDGTNAETIGAARLRAREELRARDSAVTREDFQFQAGEAPVKLARALCLEPEPGEAIPVYVLPAIDKPLGQLTPEQLTPDDELIDIVKAHLDERRLVGTRVDVMPVGLRWVTAVVQVAAAPRSDPTAVEERVEAELYRFVNPIVGGVIDGPGDGWGFGRPLNQGELYALVHDVPGVEHVRSVRIYETSPDPTRPGAPLRPAPQPAGDRIEIDPWEVVCSATHRVKVDAE
jgi:predicted phage baseplate assembly protein